MPVRSPNENEVHRPGVISALFVYQAGVMAAAFWTWLAVLAVRTTPVTGWHLVAMAGAITSTLACALLGARHALQRNAAARHEQIMRALVDISWHSFATSEPDGNADVIRLPPQQSRPRPRR